MAHNFFPSFEILKFGRIRSASLGQRNSLFSHILAHPCPMCLAAMYYCSPDRVTFITTRDDYAKFYVDDRKYFSLENFYAEIAKPWQERAMPMRYTPHPSGIKVYEHWKELNLKV